MTSQEMQRAADDLKEGLDRFQYLTISQTGDYIYNAMRAIERWMRENARPDSDDNIPF